MPESLTSIAIASASAFAVAIFTLWAARKAGLTDMQRQVREESNALAETLRSRVDHLERENERLTEENTYLRRELEQLRDEVQRLQRHIINDELRRAD